MAKKCFFETVLRTVGTLGVVLVFGMMLAGCASNPKIETKYMKPTIPKEEHSVLIVDPFIAVSRVNNQTNLQLFVFTKPYILPLPAGGL
jgi:hypothetical protein